MARRAAPVVPMLTCLALVVALAACGGPSARQWADRVCTALTPWRTQIAALNSTARSRVAAASSPAQIRDELAALLRGALAATEAARAEVVDAGIPDVTGGAEVAGRFIASLVAVRDAYARARAELERLPVADQSSFTTGVVGIFDRLNADYARTAPDTSALSSPQLQAAFADLPRCR
jgi:hypothetical protein